MRKKGKVLIMDSNNYKSTDGLTRRELLGLMNNLNQLIKLSHQKGRVVPGINETVNKISTIIGKWC